MVYKHLETYSSELVRSSVCATVSVVLASLRQEYVFLTL